MERRNASSHSHKRTERGDSQDWYHGGDKQVRISSEEIIRWFRGSSIANGAELEPLNVASRRLSETYLAPSHPLPTKLSSIYTTNENNKGISINGSHEDLPGKSSTDVTAADVSKSGGLPLNALEENNMVFQLQKDCIDFLKQSIPWLKKGVGSNSAGSPQVNSKEGLEAPSSSSGILPMPVPSVTAVATVAAGATSASTLPPAAEHEDKLYMEKITISAEHPCPTETAPSAPQQVKLTKKKRLLAGKKEMQEMIRIHLNRPVYSVQQFLLWDKELQEMIRRHGFIGPPKAKKKMSYAFGPPNTLLKNVLVSVYKINDLSDPLNRHMVCTLPHEYGLAGCAVITDGISVVVVGGRSKSIERYKQLLLRRINRAAVKNKAGDDDGKENPVNDFVLLWEGIVAKPSFNIFSVHECRTEAAARQVFVDAGVTEYWDLAVEYQI